MIGEPEHDEPYPLGRVVALGVVIFAVVVVVAAPLLAYVWHWWLG